MREPLPRSLTSAAGQGNGDRRQSDRAASEPRSWKIVLGSLASVWQHLWRQLLVELRQCDVHTVVKRIIRVWLLKQECQATNHCVQIKNGFPTLPQNIEAHFALVVNVGVIDLW